MLDIDILLLLRYLVNIVSISYQNWNSDINPSLVMRECLANKAWLKNCQTYGSDRKQQTPLTRESQDIAAVA